jgi:uncharacterized protein YcbX
LNLLTPDGNTANWQLSKYLIYPITWSPDGTALAFASTMNDRDLNSDRMFMLSETMGASATGIS